MRARTTSAIRLASLGSVFVTLILSTLGNAAPLTFFGEDQLTFNGFPRSLAAQRAFLAQLTGVSVESFESFPAGTSLAGAGIVVRFGSDTATLQGSTAIVEGAPSFGTFATSGSKFIDNNFSALALTFSTPQAAFGFFGTDIGDINGQLSLSFDGRPPVLVPHVVGGNNQSALFFGIIDTESPFTHVQFVGSSREDRFGFDDFTIGRREQVVGTLVPEPASIAIWSLVSVVVGIISWRRKRRVTAR